jgi:hypothetical protein
MSDWSVDNDMRRFGSRSMRCLVTAPAGIRTAYPVENDAGADVSVTPHTAYVLSAYVNTGVAPVNADIRLAVFAEGGLTAELSDLYLDASEAVTRDTSDPANPEGWQRLILKFRTEEQTRVRPVVVYGPAGATVGDLFWVDAVQMEESPIPTGWRPGMVGAAAVLDVNGLLIDGQAGGIMRLRDVGGGVADLPGLVAAVATPVIRVERTGSTQNIAAGGDVDIIYNSIINEDDEAGDFSYNVATGILTINRAGWYSIDAGYVIIANAVGQRRINIVLDGVTIASQRMPTTATGSPVISVSCAVKVAAGAQIKATAFHDSTTTPLTLSVSRASFLSAYRIR